MPKNRKIFNFSLPLSRGFAKISFALQRQRENFFKAFCRAAGGVDEGQVAIKTRDYYKVHDFLTVGAAAPLQEAVIPGLRFGREYYDELLKTYTHKRDLFVQGLDAIGLEHTTPQGAYYVLMDISRYGYKSDLEFCEMLARDVGVGAVPGSSFFREDVNHLIRFHFAKKDETLHEALNRLEKLKKL